MEEDIKTTVAILKEWAKINLIGSNFLSPIGYIYISARGIKEIINQPHRFHKENIMSLYEIEKLLATAEFVKITGDTKDRPFVWHYLKITIANNNSYIVVREDIQSGNKMLYSIVDHIK